AHDSCRELRTRWLIHKRHEFVRKSRHRAANADAAHIGTASNTVHPASLGNVAVHYWSPAAQLYEALRRAVLRGEHGLLVVAATITAFVDGFAEEPGRSSLCIQWDHWGHTCYLVEQVEQSLHE